MNQVPSPQCPHCGRNLSTDDLRGQNCPSCGTALPHHARAAQQVALVNQIMAQHMAAPPPYVVQQNPYYANAMHQAHAANAASAKSMRIVFIVIGAIVGLSFLVALVGGILAFALAR